MVTAKRVRILGVASASRIASYGDIPTFKENGVDLQISGWQGFFAPRGAPAAAMKLLNESVEKILRDPEVLQSLAKIDVQAAYLPPREFAGFLSKEDAEMKQLTRELGLMVTSPK
jgi:tripartite-type tricarboxylate transporter receptor subunit TctC